MAILSVKAFAPLMRQRVLLAPWTGYDAFGAPSYGADVSYQAAVVGDLKLVRSATGQQVPSMQTVYLMSAVAVNPNDRVTLSTQDVDSTENAALKPPIVGVGRFPFLRGMFFTTIYL